MMNASAGMDYKKLINLMLTVAIHRVKELESLNEDIETCVTMHTVSSKGNAPDIKTPSHIGHAPDIELLNRDVCDLKMTNSVSGRFGMSNDTVTEFSSAKSKHHALFDLFRIQATCMCIANDADYCKLQLDYTDSVQRVLDIMNSSTIFQAPPQAAYFL